MPVILMYPQYSELSVRCQSWFFHFFLACTNCTKPGNSLYHKVLAQKITCFNMSASSFFRYIFVYYYVTIQTVILKIIGVQSTEQSVYSSRTHVRLGAWFWSAKADIFFSESLHILAERLSQSEIELPLRKICYYSPLTEVGVSTQTEMKIKWDGDEY